MREPFATGVQLRDPFERVLTSKNDHAQSKPLSSSTGELMLSGMLAIFEPEANTGGRGTSKHSGSPQASLRGLAQGDLTMLHVLQHVIEGTWEELERDPQTFMGVHLAALATLGAAPASWLRTSEIELEPERVLGTRMANAPVIGPARVVATAGSNIKADERAEDDTDTEPRSLLRGCPLMSIPCI